MAVSQNVTAQSSFIRIILQRQPCGKNKPSDTLTVHCQRQRYHFPSCTVNYRTDTYKSSTSNFRVIFRDRACQSDLIHLGWGGINSLLGSLACIVSLVKSYT